MGNCFGTPADSDADDAPKQYSWDTRPDVNPDVSIVVTDPSQFSPPLISSLCFSFVLMGYGMTSFVCAATLRAGLHLQRLGRSDRRQDAGDYRWPNVYAGTSEKLHSVSKVGMRLQLCLIASLSFCLSTVYREQHAGGYGRGDSYRHRQATRRSKLSGFQSTDSNTTSLSFLFSPFLRKNNSTDTCLTTCQL